MLRGLWECECVGCGCGDLTSVLLQRVTANCVHAAVTRTMDRIDDEIGSCNNFDLLQLLRRSPSHQWEQFARVLCLLGGFFFSSHQFFPLSFRSRVFFSFGARDMMHVRFCTRYTISEKSRMSISRNVMQCGRWHQDVIRIFSQLCWSSTVDRHWLFIIINIAPSEIHIVQISWMRPYRSNVCPLSIYRRTRIYTKIHSISLWLQISQLTWMREYHSSSTIRVWHKLKNYLWHAGCYNDAAEWSHKKKKKNRSWEVQTQCECEKKNPKWKALIEH